MKNREKLIKDIENLLNTHKGVTKTSINPALLEFMDENALKSIISMLLDEKEKELTPDTKWLEQFKTVD